MIHNSFAQLDLRSPSIVLVTPPLSSCALERSKYHSIYQFKFIRRLSSQLTKLKRQQPLADLCFLSQYVSERIICGFSWWCIHFIPSFVSSRSLLVVPSLFLLCRRRCHPGKVSRLRKHIFVISSQYFWLNPANHLWFIMMIYSLYSVISFRAARVIVPVPPASPFPPFTQRLPTHDRNLNSHPETSGRSAVIWPRLMSWKYTEGG